MASLVLSGDTSGSITLAAPAVAGSTTQTLVNVTGTLAPIVSGTSVTCAGQTSIDFTGIPSWVKRITVMLQGVSTSGTNPIIIQLGAGSFTTSGYIGYGANTSGASVAGALQTSGIPMINATVAANTYSGIGTIATLGSNAWAASATLGSNAAAGGYGGGSITLSGTLDRVRITTVGGTDTFDTTPSAGTINILYE